MMTMQRLCQTRVLPALVSAVSLSIGSAAGADAPVHDYPTVARVEFVQDCIRAHGGKLENLYQCSCAIDRIANALSYDDFVEASTYAKYASLPGEGGGIFRDSDQARQMAKHYREVEAEAYRSCGLGQSG
jgi:hypothetical protein